ncbi:patched domain-containing protein 3-like [Symsagittifera roscoffensis]|uniref:patched domain-containing protein 3-like n=1 Tax=Symsagittifera roscoffensis TaxID=84072 RepID=UPI00307C036F
MHEEYKQTFNFTVDHKQDLWSHQQSGELLVFLSPKDAGTSSESSKSPHSTSEFENDPPVIQLDDVFWKDMRTLCEEVREGVREQLSFAPLRISLWDRYTCGKKSGSCWEPWVCYGGRNKSVVSDYEAEVRQFSSNTRLTNPLLETVWLDVAGNEKKDFEGVATNQKGSDVSNVTRIGVAVKSARNILLAWHYYPDEVGYYWDLKTYENILRSPKVFGGFGLECCEVHIFSRVAFFKQVDESVKAQLPLFIMTVVSIVGLCVALNWKHSWIHSRATLAIAVILATFMAIGNGLVTGMHLGIPFIALVSLTPFIILGVGIDSGLILIRAWSTEDSVADVDRSTGRSILLDPVERTSRTIGKTFTSIFMSDLTSILAFLIGSCSQFPAVNYACQYLTLCLLYLFILECTFLTACLVLHNKRVDDGRHCVCCWETVTEGEEQVMLPCYPRFDLANTKDNTLERDLSKMFGKLVSSLWLRCSILLFTAALVTFSSYHLYHMTTGAPPDAFLLEHSQLKSFLSLDVSVSRFPTSLAVVIESPIAYWDKRDVEKGINLTLGSP